MNQLSANILSLSTEAAVLVEKNRISFVNAAAAALLGPDCEGKSVKDVFGQDIAGIQASSFIGDVPIRGKHCIVRVSKLDFGQIIFLSPAGTEPVFLNDALIYSANSTLSTINMAVEAGVVHAEALGDNVLLTGFRSLSRSCYSLTRLITNAGIVRSIADGSLSYEFRQTNLSLLYGSLLDTIHILYPKAVFALDLGKDITAPVDCNLAMQLLFNLVSNCLMHAEGCSKISISLMESGDNVVLSVSDNGRGIPPEELHGIFDRYKHSFGAVQMGKGPGLGLSVVRGAAEIHGGTLLVESRLNQGTCVRVSFSKRTDEHISLQAPVESYFGQMRSILIGLADCLPAECFSEKFKD